MNAGRNPVEALLIPQILQKSCSSLRIAPHLGLSNPRYLPEISPKSTVHAAPFTSIPENPSQASILAFSASIKRKGGLRTSTLPLDRTPSLNGFLP
ncbi:hypothetical protein KFK09_006818 [Dendrobium nobile]|uniref:Uncharacterized protein n=1 Tax=Dendrobium nobile TaxID=94219 RepID=A0A8T3B3E7_DENNO|nr:hypothetical protein KFK09_017435 [Dendrobium nobile]KAI0519372.1 hypothetical protein KFK09_006818 [Dendrobium nobile]